MDYAKEIYKTILNYLPLTNIELGRVLPSISIDIEANKVVMEFDEDDYGFITSQITDKTNYSYTASNFRLKNRILSIQTYPEFSNILFGFVVKFERPITEYASEDIELKGFANTNFNTTYRIIRKIDDFNIVIAPINSLAITIPSGNLGYQSVLYAGGLNGAKIITDEGDNKISFPIDVNISSVSDIDDLDLTTMPNLWFYQDNLLVLNPTTFERFLTDVSNQDYLIIDSTSLSGSPIRSQNNKTDALYFSFGSNALFYRSYSIDIIYLIQRAADDQKNQISGSDIAQKQSVMFDALNSILRRPIKPDNKRMISSITITEDSNTQSILEGRVNIVYRANFVVNYMPDSIVDISDVDSYKIKQINYNSDQIII